MYNIFRHPKTYLIHFIEGNYSSSIIVYRDPTGFVRKLHKTFSEQVVYDTNPKDQRLFKSGSTWTSEFSNSNIVYVSGFFTLGLQLLYANVPCIIFVTPDSIYPHLKTSSNELLRLGVFVDSISDLRSFSSQFDLNKWWDESYAIRNSFLSEYETGIINFFGIKHLTYID